MKAIDFRFRPNTPDAVDGLIHSPFFGDMCAFFNYPDRAWSASLDKIVEIMDEHEITGVITGRDVETTYGCPCSNMGVVEMMRAYPHKFYGMAGLDPHKGMQAIDELSRMVNEFGMKGASVDPYLAKLPADHRKFYPIYAKWFRWSSAPDLVPAFPARSWATPPPPASTKWPATSRISPSS